MNKKNTRLMAALALLTLLIPFSGWGQASITIDPAFLTLDAEMHQGDDFLPITYKDIIVENARSFGFQFYTAEGEETETQIAQMGTGPAYYATTSPWCFAMVTPQTGNDAFQVAVATYDNDGEEARSVFFKVYAYDADSTLVYSNLAAVTQAAPGDNFFYFYKDIAGYGQAENGNYYLIASPVASNVTPSVENRFLTNEYDLYWFDQTEDEEWRNYKANNFNIESGKGYLYANKNGVKLTFAGEPYSGDGVVDLSYNANAEFAGWNLIGNPFGSNATIDKPYYRMNEYGNGFESATQNDAVSIMEGVFVQATEPGQKAQFTQYLSKGETKHIAQVNIKVSGSDNMVDNAIIRFDNGETLSKFQLNQNSTKLYFTEGNQDYAIVRSNAQGEMPVNFKAQNNGTYTLSINLENVEMNYLHLIDNMTGTDVDLLANPSYTFEAKTTDYASRFRLVFNVTGVEENTTCTEPFAFFNGSEWIVSNMGEATLQVVDMLGRVLSTETVNGNYEKSLNVAPGVYMIRLINGNDVKVQKMIVK